MTHLSGMESESDLSEVPTVANVLGVLLTIFRRRPSICGRRLP